MVFRVCCPDLALAADRPRDQLEVVERTLEFLVQLDGSLLWHRVRLVT